LQSTYGTAEAVPYKDFGVLTQTLKPGPTKRARNPSHLGNCFLGAAAPGQVFYQVVRSQAF